MRGASGSPSRATSGSSRSRCGKSRSSTVASCSSGTSARPSFSPTTGRMSRGRMARSHLIRPIRRSLPIHRVRPDGGGGGGTGGGDPPPGDPPGGGGGGGGGTGGNGGGGSTGGGGGGWPPGGGGGGGPQPPVPPKPPGPPKPPQPDPPTVSVEVFVDVEPGRTGVLHPAAADLHGLRERLHQRRACRRRARCAFPGRARSRSSSAPRIPASAAASSSRTSR